MKRSLPQLLIGALAADHNPMVDVARVFSNGTVCCIDRMMGDTSAGGAGRIQGGAPQEKEE